MMSVKNFFTQNKEQSGKNMIKLGCDKSGDSRILMVEDKFLNINCQTCYTIACLTVNT